MWVHPYITDSVRCITPCGPLWGFIPLWGLVSYLTLVWRFLICVCSVVHSEKLPPLLGVCELHTSIINIRRLITYYLKAQFMWRKLHHHEKVHRHVKMNLLQLTHARLIMYFLQDLIYIHRSIWLVIQMLTFSCIVFSNNILNVYIRCIWFNVTYIIPNFCRTTMLCDRDIIPTMCYLKCPFIWRLIFESRIFIQNYFIFKLIVVV